MRRSTRRLWVSIAVGAIIVLLPTLLDLFKAPIATTTIFSSFPLWTDAVGLVVTAGLISALTYLSSKPISPLEMSVTIVRVNRQIMLDRVKAIWIAGFLENQLYYEEQPWPLPLRERVGSLYDQALYDPLEPAHSLPPDTKILDRFDQAEGQLLILGEPGAGKTTLLLELARDLLQRARLPESEAPIPVVLTLSSWATKQLPLEQWVIEELKMKYQVATEIGQAWVANNQLLLLLDGLDEVAPHAQPACIQAVNRYMSQAHRSLIVCSRTNDYLGQTERLSLRTAVTVQPLSSNQIGDYLDSLATKGEDVEGLKHALHQSESLRTLATTSLLLKVLILAYHGKSAQELLPLVNTALTDQQHRLFHDYVERMLQREGSRMHASEQQTKHWLAWLAQQLTEHHQTEFYLEQLQPDWLPDERRAFYRWSVRLVVGLLLGLDVGLVAGLRFGLVAGLLLGLIFGLSTGLQAGRGVDLATIKLVEDLTWSWSAALSGLLFGLGVGLFVGLGLGLLVGAEMGLGLVAGLSVVLFFVLLFVLLFGLAIGLGSGELTERLTLSPNEGIRRSVKNGLLVGLLVGLVVGPSIGLLFGLGSGLRSAGLVAGLVAGLSVVLVAGLGAAVKHSILCFWLWRAQCTSTPWLYVAFLDDAADQLLLRKAGGGYVFRHPLLQVYFASSDVLLPPQSSVRTEARSG